MNRIRTQNGVMRDKLNMLSSKDRFLFKCWCVRRAIKSDVDMDSRDEAECLAVVNLAKAFANGLAKRGELTTAAINVSGDNCWYGGWVTRSAFASAMTVFGVAQLAASYSGDEKVEKAAQLAKLRTMIRESNKGEHQ